MSLWLEGYLRVIWKISKLFILRMILNEFLEIDFIFYFNYRACMSPVKTNVVHFCSVFLLCVFFQPNNGLIALEIRTVRLWINVLFLKKWWANHIKTYWFCIKALVQWPGSEGIMFMVELVWKFHLLSSMKDVLQSSSRNPLSWQMNQHRFC